MAWIQKQINNINDYKVHFTPIENKELILKYGILLPVKGRKIEGHVRPYDRFEATRLHQKPSAEKDAYTYFAKSFSSTFTFWRLDASFIDGNVGFLVKDERLFFDHSDPYGFGRYRVAKDIPPERINATLKFVSKVPENHVDFDFLVTWEEGIGYKVYEWKEQD